MQMRKWTFATAQITFLLVEKGDLPSFFLPSYYKPFVISADSEVNHRIELHTGLLPIHPQEVDYTFVAKKIWGTFMWKQGWGFLNPVSQDMPWRRCILWDPIKHHIDLWFPFNAPTGNLFGDLRFPFLAAFFAQNDAALVHASAANLDDGAWLFVGPSGYGKSQWAHFCQQRGYTVLDEDRVVLRKLNGAIWAFGIPWHPEPRLCSLGGAPIRRIFFLRQTEPDTLLCASDTQASVLLIKSFLMPIYDPQAMETLLALAAQTVEQTENYLLGYVSDEQLPASVFSL